MAKMIYADANGATAMPPQVLDAWVAAANRGHPTAGSITAAKGVKTLLDKFQRRIESYSAVQSGEFRYILTSGRDEANVLIITSCVGSAACKNRAARPHVVVGVGSPPSIIDCLRQLRGRGMCTFNFAHIDPAAGTITPDMVRNAMRGSTCLVTVPAVTATGEIIDLKSIEGACFAPKGRPGTRIPIASAGATAAEAAAASAARKAMPKFRVPLHVDASVLHGRSVIYPSRWGIDAYSVDASLINGPPGFGMLAVRESLCQGYDMRAMITGRPINLPGLTATHVALEYTLSDRTKKNAHLAVLTGGVVTVLKEAMGKNAYWYPSAPPPDLAALYKQLLDGKTMYAITHDEAAATLATKKSDAARDLVFLSPPEAKARLPNMLVFAIRNGKTALENKATLEEKHNIVCAELSDAGEELPLVPPWVQKYTLRISFPDELTKKEAQSIALGLVDVCRAQA